MKMTSTLILAATALVAGLSAPAFADEAPNAVTGIVRAVTGSTLTVETRSGEQIRVDQTEALAGHYVAPGVKVGTPVYITGVRSGNALRAATVTRTKPAVGTWAPDR